MSELIHEFSGDVVDEDGRVHTARIRGEADEHGHWQGWIEFLPRDGGPALQTGRETTQGQRDHLEYWATGLSAMYLEQALGRARRASSREPGPPPGLEEVPLEAPEEDAPGIHTLEIESLDPDLPRRLLGVRSAAPGALLRVRGAGVLVFDGEAAPEGDTHTFRFRAQIGSDNTGAVNMGNRLWSALREEAASLRIDGHAVRIRSHDIIEALRGRY